MNTSTSLFDRLQRNASEADWRRLDDLYRPLIQRWLRIEARLGDEADDLTQDILTVVVDRLPGFQRERTGSFRCWLRRITHHRLLNHLRQRGRQARALGASPEVDPLAELADDHSELSLRWDAEHNRHVVRRLLELMEQEFPADACQAFRLVKLEGIAPIEAARRLGLTLNQVYLATSRIRQRLRDEADDLLR